MSSLTTYGVNLSPFVGTVGGSPVQALPNYGTLNSISVGNPGGSGWGYLHLYDASNINQVQIGNTAPRLMVPVNFNTTVSPMLGTGVIFNEGVVVAAMTAVNGNVGVPTQLAVSLGFNTQPTD